MSVRPTWYPSATSCQILFLPQWQRLYGMKCGCSWTRHPYLVVDVKSSDVAVHSTSWHLQMNPTTSLANADSLHISSNISPASITTPLYPATANLKTQKPRKLLIHEIWTSRKLKRIWYVWATLLLRSIKFGAAQSEGAETFLLALSITSGFTFTNMGPPVQIQEKRWPLGEVL